MIWKLIWKYVAGAALLAALGLGVWLYGNQREASGYAARDAEAKIELGQRQTALYEEQVKNEKFRAENDRKLQALKAATAAELAASASTSARLRQLAADAIRARDQALTAGGIAREGADWIGGFAACQSEYELLGKDAARIADKLRGLQDQVALPTN